MWNGYAVIAEMTCLWANRVSVSDVAEHWQTTLCAVTVFLIRLLWIVVSLPAVIVTRLI